MIFLNKPLINLLRKLSKIDDFQGKSILESRDLENYPRDRPKITERVSPDTLVCAKHVLPQWRSFARLQTGRKSKTSMKIVENRPRAAGPRTRFLGHFRFFHPRDLENYPRDRPQICVGVTLEHVIRAKHVLRHWNNLLHS